MKKLFTLILLAVLGTAGVWADVTFTSGTVITFDATAYGSGMNVYIPGTASPSGSGDWWSSTSSKITFTLTSDWTVSTSTALFKSAASDNWTVVNATTLPDDNTYTTLTTTDGKTFSWSQESTPTPPAASVTFTSGTKITFDATAYGAGMNVYIPGTASPSGSGDWWSSTSSKITFTLTSDWTVSTSTALFKSAASDNWTVVNATTLPDDNTYTTLTTTDGKTYTWSAPAPVTSKTYTVSCAEDGGGVIYNGSNYTNSQSFEAPSDLVATDMTAISVTGKKSSVEINDATITVSYTVPSYTWKLHGNMSGSWESQDFVADAGSTTASYTVSSLAASASAYEFGIKRVDESSNETWFSCPNSGTQTISETTTNIALASSDNQNFKLSVAQTGDYKFTVDFSDFDNPTLSVTFPAVPQTTYTVSCAEANGGVKYNDVEYKDGATFEAPSSKTDFEAIKIDGYSGTVTKDDATLTVTYEEKVYLIKHPWGTGKSEDWDWKQLTKDEGSNPLTYSITAGYGGDKGCNWKEGETGTSTWVKSPTLVDDPAVGDNAKFTLDPAAGTITITKVANPDVTYTVSCSEANGGVKYNEVEYKNEETFSAPASLVAAQLTAIALDGYSSSIAIDNKVVTVTYTEKVYSLKFPWNGGDWAWKTLKKDEGASTYSLKDFYSDNSGCNWSDNAEHTGAAYLEPSQLSLNGSPVKYDFAKFTLDPAAGTITITKLDLPDIYLRGEVNSWGTNDKFTKADGEDKWTLKMDVAVPFGTFKVADAEWSGCTFGGDGSTAVKANTSYSLKGTDNQNLWLDNALEANPYVFTVTRENGAWSLLVEQETYVRNLSSVKLATVCLPYAATVEGASVYSIQGVDDKTAPSRMYLDDVTTMEAGKPYVFLPEAAGDVTFTLSGAKAAAAGSENGLVGVFEDINFVDLGSVGDIYIFYNNLVCKSTLAATSGVDANRAYILWNDVPELGAQAAPSRIIYFEGGHGIQTGLEQINAQGENMKFIKNGVLYIRHNGQVFNAKGQLVK